MITGKGGKGGNDAELLIGATIDGAGLQKSWDEAFKGLKTPELVSKKATESGKKLLNSVLPKDAVAAVNRQITELEGRIRDFQKHQEKLTAAPGGKLKGADGKELAKFLKPFSAFTEGLSEGHAKLERVGQLLQGDVNNLGRLYKSIADLSRNAPTTRKELDLFAGITDKGKLQQSAANLRKAQDQLAQQKQLIADLAKVHKAALAAGQTDFARVLGGQIGLQQSQYTKDRAAVDLIAAQKRVDQELRSNANASAKERAKESKDRVKAQQKQAAEELAAYEKGQQALLTSQAKYQQIRRGNAAGVSALKTLPTAPGLDLARVTRDGASPRVNELQAAIKLLGDLEKRYSAIATQQQIAGKNNSRAVQAQADVGKAAEGYRAELERINGAVKRNRDALADQKRLGREMAKDVERELAARIAGNQKLSDMDRAAMAAQAQRARRRDAEMAKIRRANQVDTVAVGQVHAGTSALTLAEQAAAINKALALNKALVAQYDKVILAEQALGKQTAAMEAVRAREAAALDKNIKKQDELTAAIKKQTAAQVEADKKAKQVSDFRQQRIHGQDTRDRRYRYEKQAAEDRLAFRNTGVGPNLKGTSAELRQQNVELAQASKWHEKMAQALVQEEGRAKNLGISYSQISHELANHVLAIKNIAAEQQKVNLALRERERLERQSIKNQTDLAAKVKANIAANQAGHKIVGQRGGYANFNASGLNLKDAKLASEALNQMAAAMRNAFQKQAALGTATEKMRQNLDKVSNSARNAKDAVAALQKEAASAHGIQRFNQELGSTIKNFAKFAIIYQGLYGILGFFKSLTGAVVDLNAQLANMQGITASSTEQMKGISNAILSTAASSRFSIGEMTEAAKVIAQAGASAEELPKILQAVSDFSAGTDTSLATAADIITSVGEVYKTLDESQIANQLTKAVNISKLSGEDLKTIMSIGAQVAEGYNITSEQMLAAASTLRNAGVKASTIATGLRQALLEVFNPQENTLKSLQQAYAKLGQNLNTEQIKAKFFNFSKEADPLMAVLRELKNLGFGGEGDFTLGRGFDVRALNVLKELTKSTDQYLVLQREITFGQPAAEAAAASMESLTASWTKFKNVLTATIADESGPVLKGLQSMIDKMSELIEKRRELAAEDTANGNGNGSFTGKSLTNPSVLLGAGLVALGGAASLTGVGASAGVPLMVAGGTMVAGGLAQSAYDANRDPYSVEKLGGARSVAQTSQGNLDKAQAAYDAFRIDSETGVGKELTDAATLARNLKDAITEAFGQDAANSAEVNAILEELKGTATIARRKELLARLQQLSADSSKVTQDSIANITTLMDETGASTKAMLANYVSMYKQLSETASRQGPEAEQAKVALAKLGELKGADGNSISLDMLAGKGDGAQITENYKLLMGTMAEQLGAGIEALQTKVSDDRLRVFKLAVESTVDLPQAQRDAAVQQIVTGYLADISQMGAEAGKRELINLSDEMSRMFNSGGLLERLGINKEGLAARFGFKTDAKGEVPWPELPKDYDALQAVSKAGYHSNLPEGFLPIQQNLQEKDAKKKAEAARQYALDHEKVQPLLVDKVYNPNPALSAKAESLDFGITQLQKFGDAAGSAAGMIQEKNAVLAQMQNEEIKVYEHNLEVAKQQGPESPEYLKASAELSRKRLELQKIELQGKEEYLDNMQKQAVTEMSMYDQQKATILAAGGNFDGLGALNDQYMATQSKLITEMEDYMRNTLHMTEDQIQKYIESRPELKKGFLTDKDYNAVAKKNTAQEKAAAAAIPKTATTGNALMDAKARAGLGFTNAEQSQFASSKYTGIQNQISVLAGNNQSDAVLAAAADPALAEQINANIETRKAAIRDMNTELEDLSAEIETFSSTAASELASVFNAEGVQFFTHALEQSGNALKDWGDNIRDSLLTAWDSVGDAIAGAVLEGEDFVESMKKITRDLAKEVFTMTTKNMMNNLLLGAMTGSYGGATQPGQPGAAPAAGTPAATPAAGGFLSSVISALGITPAAATGAPGAAGSAVGTMTVNAGVVNVNGSTAGGAASAAEGLLGKSNELVGPPAPEKSLFQVVEDKISSGMDSVMGTLESAFKGLDAGLGGLLSGIGNIASDMFKGVADFDWGGMATKALSFFGLATGGIIPMKFAGGYVSKSGMIKGPGSGTSDSIRGSMYTKSGRAPIAVSSGESILTAKATSMLGEKTIKSLNAGTARKFSTGGMVARDRANANSANLKTPSPSVTVNPAAPQSIQMINAIDSDSVVQAGLSSPGSVKTLVNVIKANKSAFKQVLN